MIHVSSCEQVETQAGMFSVVPGGSKFDNRM